MREAWFKPSPRGDRCVSSGRTGRRPTQPLPRSVGLGRSTKYSAKGLKGRHNWNCFGPSGLRDLNSNRFRGFSAPAEVVSASGLIVNATNAAVSSRAGLDNRSAPWAYLSDGSLSLIVHAQTRHKQRNLPCLGSCRSRKPVIRANGPLLTQPSPRGLGSRFHKQEIRANGPADCRLHPIQAIDLCGIGFYPEGIPAISRRLSEATPPETDFPSTFPILDRVEDLRP